MNQGHQVDLLVLQETHTTISVYLQTRERVCRYSVVAAEHSEAHMIVTYMKNAPLRFEEMDSCCALVDPKKIELDEPGVTK